MEREKGTGHPGCYGNGEKSQNTCNDRITGVSGSRAGTNKLMAEKYFFQNRKNGLFGQRNHPRDGPFFRLRAEKNIDGFAAS